MTERRMLLITFLVLSLFTSPLAADKLTDRTDAFKALMEKGRVAEAKAEMNALLEEARAAKDGTAEGMALLFLGMSDLVANKVDAGNARIADAKKTMESARDPIGVWLVLLCQAQLEKALGHPAKAADAMAEALAAINKAKVSDGPFSFRLLGVLAPKEAMPPGAMEMMEAAGPMAKPILLQFSLEPLTRAMYAGMLIDAGKLEKAETELNGAIAAAAPTNGMYDSLFARYLGDLRFAQKRYDDAREQYKKAQTGSSGVPMGEMFESAMGADLDYKLMQAELLTGHLDEAIILSGTILTRVRTLRNPAATCIALENRGNLLVRAQRYAEADSTLQQAMEVAAQAKIAERQKSIASQLGALAIARLLMNDAGAPDDALDRARKLMQQGSYPLGNEMVALADVWLRYRKGEAAAKDVQEATDQLVRAAKTKKMELPPNFEQIVHNSLDAAK